MDLQVQQHDLFQQREWSIVRTGWVALVVFVLAGLTGLLGTGPLSWTTATGSGGLVSVEFQRVTHHEADDSLTLEFAPVLGEDFSLMQAALVIATLLLLDRGSDHLSFRSLRFRRVTESVPVVLVADGRPLEEILGRCQLSVDDVMTAGREAHGLERMDQVKWAVLECSGGISVVPYEPRPPTTGHSPATARPAATG